MISGADPNGAAARAGLQAGDVIEKVGDVPVGDAASLAHALDNARNDTALLLIDRSGQRRYLAVPLG